MMRANRRLVAVSGTAVACLLAGETALACPVCFQVESGPVTDGVQAAVWLLSGVTTSVLAGFAIFAGRVVRRLRAGSGRAPERPST